MVDIYLNEFYNKDELVVFSISKEKRGAFVHYKYLLDIALILLFTKFLGLVFQRLHMPQVVGSLIAGLLLGPAVLNFVQETDFLATTASLGVILLMFIAGMETDINELKSCGKAATVIAVAGVVTPLLGGWAAGAYFFPDLLTIEHIFLGIILTATSVSITVETLREMGKLRGPVGSAILGAAIIDDVLGIVALTIVTSFSTPDVNVALVLVKIVLFFVFAIFAGLAFARFFRWWTHRTEENRTEYVILAFVFCLLFSFMAEYFFGVTDITGAFMAGLMISNTMSAKHSLYMSASFEAVSFLYLAPVFFASIGLKVVLEDMTSHIILFAVVLTIVAVLSKLLGCGLGARVTGFDTKQSIQIGVGMVSRGEVALIVASKGADLHLVSPELFGPVVVVVVVTTIITPILLKLAFQDRQPSTIPMHPTL